MYGKKLALLLVFALIVSTVLSPMVIQAQGKTDEEDTIAMDIDESGANGEPEDPETKFMYSDRNGEEYAESPEAIDEDNSFGAVKSKKPVESEEKNQEMGILAAEPSIDMTDAGSIALKHLEYLSENIGQRVAFTSKKPEEKDKKVNKVSGENDALKYIETVLGSYYDVEIQPFSAELRDKNDKVTDYVYSANVIAVKTGLSGKQIIVGAHYDSVDVKGSKGADDNSSGVAIMLEAAERLANMDTPYTIKFIAFGAEELGLKGSEYYVSQMNEEEIKNTVMMVNLDSCAVGDNMYVYGDEGEKGWGRELALSIARENGLNLQTNPGLNSDYPKGTAGDWSDHAPFKSAGIPYTYFEATNWELGELDGYTQVALEYGDNGEIWHTKYDNMEYIEETFPGRISERLSTFSQVLTKLLLQSGETSGVKGMELSESMVSMTEVKGIEVTLNFGYTPNLNALEWTLGGMAFSEWKKYKSGSYSGDPFVTFSAGPAIENGKVKATIKFDLPYGTTDLSGSARRLYPSLIGYYDLQVKDAEKNEILSETLRINPYDSYHTYDEFKPAIDEIFENAQSDRYLEYKSLGKTVDGRDAHFVILAENKESVDEYLNSTVEEMTGNPDKLQKKLENGSHKDYKVPIWFNNIHPDEAPGPDAIFELLEELATKDTITYKLCGSTDVPTGYEGWYSNLEIPGQEETITIDVDEALDNIIFLFNFTENPDGRFYNARANVNGFDVNRDNGYQTQVESIMTTGEIAKWKPISFLDFHGFVNGFLLEPCTTPHEPNYEYDLLIENMVEQANLMGRAGIANTKYTNYEIPYEDYPGTWDDGTPAYTPTYAMFHGSLGHTIEIPDLNQDSVDALVAAGFASTRYVLDNKEELMMNQLEYFERGIEGLDSREVDQYLMNAAGEVIGRPRGGNENFFPEYYVIPVDENLQRNTSEAYKIVEYLLRNGIKASVSKKDVEAEGVTYPAGSFVVDMHQAMRGYANCVLYDGYDVSDFAELYAEIVMNFHDTRGFDRYAVRIPDAFRGAVKEIDGVEIPETSIPDGTGDLVVRNISNDAVRAVNELLDSGSTVKMLVSSGEDYEAGDFLVPRNDLESIKDGYLLKVVNYDNASTAKAILRPDVAVTGTGHLKFALSELGFNIVSSTAKSNILVADSTTNISGYLQEGKPYIGISRNGIRNVSNSGLLPGIEFVYTGYEGLLRAHTSQDSLITANYGADEILYDSQGAYISSVPEGAEVLVWVSDKDDYFKAGWWTGNEVVRGMTLAVSAKAGNSDVTLFANNIVNKAHPQKEWRMLANAIFASNLED
ncbi:MAG: M20/M25/M40 family metallo-hydrolase [Caulobacteraceae bacterium]